MKKILKALFPKKFLAHMSLLRHYYYDYKKYKSSSAFFRKTMSKYNYENHISRLAHSVEKGLSHVNIRPGFGKDNILSLSDLLSKYRAKFRIDDNATRYFWGVSVVKKYISAHKEIGFNIDFIDSNSDIFSDMYNRNFVGVLEKEHLSVSFYNSFSSFSQNRYSIRDYGIENVDKRLIEKAFDLAQKAPSVCNRQPWHSIIVNDPENIKKVLEIQKGFKAFGKNVQGVIIILSKLEFFDGVEERNQGYVDGGIYTLNLVYSLHNFDIATCILNAAFPINWELRLRGLLQIPNQYNIVSMISYGSYPSSFVVAQSPRDNFQEHLSYEKFVLEGKE